MGLLTPEEAERVKEEAASVEGIVKVVSLIELI
jgi:osmotically-inducible protein OsmY